MKTLNQFIEENKIKMTFEEVNENPNMKNEEWRADHYKCLLKREGKQMTIYFSKGIGHNGAEPTTEELLNCIALDSRTHLDNETFENFCSEFGYEQDKEARFTYNAVMKQGAKAEKFLGRELLEELIYNVEQL